MAGWVDGKVALVTEAARGIGRAATALAREGADVIGLDIAGPASVQLRTALARTPLLEGVFSPPAPPALSGTGMTGGPVTATTAHAPPAAEVQPGTARLAYTLAGVSGYVDGVGVATLAGLFVSFMSGNTSSTGIAAGQGDWAKAAHSGLPVALYVVGSLLGSLLLLRRSPRALSLTYVLIALLLALFAWLTLAVPQRGWWAEALALALLVVPMAMMNTTLRHVGPTSVGLGYVTGTLASLGEALAARIAGSRKPGQARSIGLHVGLWLGFFGGAALGSFAVHRWSSWAVLLPVLILLVVAARTAQFPPPRPADL